ncbi:MAG: iron-containing alcohol dehydrogenase [Treponema sp.]
MGDFVFNLSPNLIAGVDVLISLGDYVSKYGSRFMLIIDPAFKDVELLVRIKQSLEKKSLKLFTFDGIQKTADSETIVRALRLAQVAHVDAVIALGDVVTCFIAKAIASLYNEEKTIYNYLEGEAIVEPSIPLIQIPTTCNNPFLFTDLVYVSDSRSRALYTIKCKPDVCSLVLFDSNIYKKLSLNAVRLMLFSALTIAFEAYVSRKANFFSDALIKKVFSFYMTALNFGADNAVGQSIEEIMCQAGVLLAMGVKSSNIGLASAISLITNGKYDVDMPSMLSVLSSFVLEDAITSNLSKVLEFSEIFLGSACPADITLEEFSLKCVEAVREKLLSIELPSKIASLDLVLEDMTSVSEDVLKLDFMNYIPRSLTSNDVLEIIKKAF